MHDHNPPAGPPAVEPAPRPATLPESLMHKAAAIRAQLQLHEAEIELAATRGALARAYRDALVAGLPAVEAECLAALGAPSGARFDWATLGVAREGTP